MSEDRKQVIKLLAKRREVEEECRQKLALLDAEIDALLGGGETIGKRIARIKLGFSDAWQARYGSPYVFTNHARVSADIKKLLVDQPESEIALRAARYLADNDGFYANARHPWEIFLKAFNRFVPQDPRKGEDFSLQRLREMRG